MLDNLGRLAMFMFIGYESSEAFKFLGAETNGFMVSKEAYSDEVAEWSYSLEMSRISGSTDHSTHHYEVGL